MTEHTEALTDEDLVGRMSDLTEIHDEIVAKLEGLSREELLKRIAEIDTEIQELRQKRTVAVMVAAALPDPPVFATREQPQEVTTSDAPSKPNPQNPSQGRSRD
jgi:hypothetical protein